MERRSEQKLPWKEKREVRKETVLGRGTERKEEK